MILDFESDALLLPWQEDGELLDRILGEETGSILQEALAYPVDRSVRLTSPGGFSSRFLFHLSTSQELSMLESLKEGFRQARLLGLRELALPLEEFSSPETSFPQLLGELQEAWKASAGAGQTLHLMARRGELWARYLQEQSISLEVPADPFPGKSDEIPFPGQKREAVLRPRLSSGLDPEEALCRLLGDYRNGKSLDASMKALRGGMLHSLSSSMEEWRGYSLPAVLRILGSSPVLRLPWELLRDGDRYLGENRILPRGSSFYMLGQREPGPDLPWEISLYCSDERRDALEGELYNLLLRSGARRVSAKSREERRRMVYLSGTRALEEFFSKEERCAGDLAFVDDVTEDWEDPLEEAAGQILARGYRSVLAPLAPFRDRREGKLYHMALFENYFRSASLERGFSLAQKAMIEAFGSDSGWFLYRVFGQVDERYPLGGYR